MFVWRGAHGDHPELRDANFKKFTEALLTEVMPQVESEYRITKDRNARAIAGLSMGGSESLLTGLNHLDKFSWIGAFSSGGIPDDFEKDFPALDAKANQQLHLLWIACGTEDHLITINRNLREWLKTKGVKQPKSKLPGCTPGWYGEGISRSSRRCYSDNAEAMAAREQLRHIHRSRFSDGNILHRRRPL